MFIRLSVRGDGEKAVDLTLVEALKAEALPGHEATNASAPLHEPLNSAGCHSMRNIMPNTATLAVCSSITQLYCIARIRLFVAALSGLFDQQHTGSLPWVGRQAGLSIPGREAPDDLCLLRFSFAQVHKVQSGLASFASGPGGLGTGYSGWVIDTGTLGQCRSCSLLCGTA